MSITRTLICDRCKAKADYSQYEEHWRHCYLVAPRYSPGYNEQQTLLCPKCISDHGRFLAGHLIIEVRLK